MASVCARAVDEIDGVARMIEVFANECLTGSREHIIVVGGALAIQRSIRALWDSVGPCLMNS